MDSFNRVFVFLNVATIVGGSFIYKLSTKVFISLTLVVIQIWVGELWFLVSQPLSLTLAQFEPTNAPICSPQADAPPSELSRLD